MSANIVGFRNFGCTVTVDPSEKGWGGGGGYHQ